MLYRIFLWRMDAVVLERDFLLLIGSVLFTLAIVSIGNAATLSDQEQRERQLRKQQEPSPEVRLPAEISPVPKDYPDNESPCFPISRIKLVGDEARHFQFALKAAADAVGRCLGAQGINLALTRIQNAIIAKGYVTTRVLAMSQDLKSGKLVFTVIPGRVNAIWLSSDSSSRGHLWNAFPLSSGDLLNLRDIEQGLENLKRVPSSDADIEIQPAEKPGESDLVVKYKQSFPFRLSLIADDSGSKSTGKYQGGATVSCDNCTTLNDLFYVSFNQDFGSGSEKRDAQSYSAYYSIPSGFWLASTSLAHYHYHQNVIGSSAVKIIYSGQSTITDLKLSRGIYRDAVRKLVVSARVFDRVSENFIDEMAVKSQGLNTRGWDFGLHHREHLWAATLDTSLTYRYGKGKGVFTINDSSGEAWSRRASDFQLLLADVNLNIPFAVNLPWGQQKITYQTLWRGQWDFTPLLFQDRFSIGGRYTVRGFDGEQTLLAERGWLTRNDLGFALGESAQELYLAADYGTVKSSGLRQFASEGALAGAAVGLRGTLFKRLQYDAFLGWPIDKPEHFKTADTTGGFSVSASF